MAKTAGGVRGGGGSKNFASDARSLFNNIERNYGRSIDFSGHQEKKLRSLQRLGESYNPKEKKTVIQTYESSARRITAGAYRSIDHSSLSGIRSAVIEVAHRAAAYRNLDAITAELKRRKRR